MKSNPLVSIIIPTYNRLAVLKDAVRSVTQQTYGNWELIVVDDQSTDQSFELMKGYTENDRRIKLTVRSSDKVKGANTCRNIGLALARGELIKFLDSDDLLHPDCLTKQVDTMLNGHYDVCFCQANFFTMKGDGEISFIEKKRWGKLQPAANENMIEEYVMGGLRWATPAGLWKKTFLPQRPFLEGLQNSQEWLMHLSMIILDPSIIFINEPLIHVRVHTSSMSNKANKNGKYYYNQCVARVEALKLLAKAGKRRPSTFLKLTRSIVWNHLFVFYKGSAFVGGLRLFKMYGTMIKSFIKKPDAL